jgi:hypothetical protein
VARLLDEQLDDGLALRSIEAAEEREGREYLRTLRAVRHAPALIPPVAGSSQEEVRGASLASLP